MRCSPHKLEVAAGMKRWLDSRSFWTGLGIVSLLAWGLHALSHLNVWVCFGIALVAMWLNGIVATIEDERPGGLHNPKPHDSGKRQREG